VVVVGELVGAVDVGDSVVLSIIGAVE